MAAFKKKSALSQVVSWLRLNLNSLGLSFERPENTCRLNYLIIQSWLLERKVQI
jgi:hypothetical protein